MSPVALLLFASLSAGAPAMDDARDADRTPLRCRPAPYYVADRVDRQRPERVLITGSRVPVTLLEERRARPCHLMLTPSPVEGPDRRVAD